MESKPYVVINNNKSARDALTCVNGDEATRIASWLRHNGVVAIAVGQSHFNPRAFAIGDYE